MTIERLTESAVVADLLLVPALAAFFPQLRDADSRVGGDDLPSVNEQRLTISVSAKDEGEFYRQSTGFRKMQIEVAINANALADGSGFAVLSCGSVSAIGYYTPRGTHNDLPFYNLTTAPDAFQSRSVYHSGANWRFLDLAGDTLYYSSDPVERLRPDLVEVWTREDGANPPPTPASFIVGTGGTAVLLDTLSELVNDRLQPSSSLIDPGEGRENSFSNSALKVAMILANETSPRTEADLIRTRHIFRTFVCAQLA
jgi:hypothetical protein